MLIKKLKTGQTHKLSKKAWFRIILATAMVINVFIHWDTYRLSVRGLEICSSRFPIRTQLERFEICNAQETLFIKKYVGKFCGGRAGEALITCEGLLLDEFANTIDWRITARREKEQKQKQETIEKLKELGACGSGPPSLWCWPAGTAIGR